MTAGEQIIRGLRAGWRFLLRDPNAVHLVENSSAGVWISFLGALLALPIYALHFALVPHPGEVNVGWFHYTLVFLLGFCLSRLIWPIVITIIAPLHRRQAFMARYIAAYNWSIPFQMMILFVTAAILSVSGVEPGTRAMITLCSYGLVMLYHSFIVNSVWRIRGRPAFMIALSEFFIVKFVLGITLLRLG
ncbi:MAG: hypothetical protein O2912_08865 [Proteobacteria bacterium]|nr:hypothetical protein [Pseudomonadota bacterium]